MSKLPSFYLSSATMATVGHLMAWERVVPRGVRRWSMDSARGRGVKIVLVHNGEICIRNVDDERYLMVTVEEMIDELGGTFEGGGVEHYENA